MGVAVVTGAGQGIGRAIVGRLANDGHRVVVVDVDGGTAKVAAEGIGGDAYECDVTDRAGVRRLADAIGAAQILVNNAGIWTYGPLIEAADADIDRVLAGARSCTSTEA